MSRVEIDGRSAIVSNFIQWLSYKPQVDEITKALATNFFHEFDVVSARIVALRTNGDIEILGEFGFDENRVGERTNSSTWRSWSGNEEPFVLTTDTQRWDTKSTICMIPMDIHSMVAGFISLYFSTPCDKSARINILKEAERYAEILALYLSLTYVQFSMSAHDIFNRGSTPSSLTENIELTERQLKILRGIASGKTNHSLAHELGYSVSTIRHETMRIFNLLNVSDRKASAQAALALGLI